jgi:hypothetical protein
MRLASLAAPVRYIHSSESRAPVRRTIATARKNLQEQKPVAVHDPRWYETMLTVARAEGWDRDQSDSLLKNHLIQWLFTPPGLYAYPAAVKRVIKQGTDGNVHVKIVALCQVQKAPCAQLKETS